MGNSIIFTSAPGSLFTMAVAIIAIGLGLYGLLLMASLSRSRGNEPHGWQVDKFMMGVFNISLSLVALYIIVITMQADTDQLFIQTNKLLGQLK
jgi:hypothetical protein